MRVKKNWKYFSTDLPEEKQKIIVYDDGLKRELRRTFYLKFWQQYGRVLDCTEFCRKWRIDGR